MKLSSIHQDKRGQILSLKSDILHDEEVTIFVTNAGFARGGCIHNLNHEHCCVINGEIEYVIGDEILIMRDGDSVLIPKGTPHYFTSWGSSIVLEWGATVAEKQVKHTEFRQIVDRINDSAD